MHMVDVAFPVSPRVPLVCGRRPRENFYFGWHIYHYPTKKKKKKFNAHCGDLGLMQTLVSRPWWKCDLVKCHQTPRPWVSAIDFSNALSPPLHPNHCKQFRSECFLPLISVELGTTNQRLHVFVCWRYVFVVLLLLHNGNYMQMSSGKLLSNEAIACWRPKWPNLSVLFLIKEVNGVQYINFNIFRGVLKVAKLWKSDRNPLTV